MYASAVDPDVTTKDIVNTPPPREKYEIEGPKEMTLPLPFVPEIPETPHKSKGDDFWVNNIEILWKDNRWLRFFPTEQDTYNEKLNSVVRAAAYCVVVLLALTRNMSSIWILLAAVVLTIVLHSQNKEQRHENFMSKPANFKPLPKQKTTYVEPTPDNPMMNVQLTDYRDQPNRESLSKVTEANDPEMKQAISKAFYDRIYRDVSDVYSSVASDRNFYTMPSTTIPNDQKAFAEFCYGTPPTCKEGNGYQCVANLEPRLRQASRPVQL